MSLNRSCRPHPAEIRKRLHADPTLGVGNFLAKVLAEDIDRDGWLFELEREWATPSGRSYRRMSLSDLEIAVGNLAGWYRAQGVKPAEVVLTCTGEGLSQFLHSVALIALGAVPAPVNWRMPADITVLYYRKYGFAHLSVDRHGYAEHVLAAVREVSSETLSALDAKPCADRTEIEPLALTAHRKFGAEDELVMLCHSSGTTGVPKAVMFGHQQFFFGKRDRLLHFLDDEDERMVCALPHSHSAGFSYLMTAVLLGLPTRVLSDLTGPGVAQHVLDFQPTVVVGFPQSYAALAESLPANSVPSLRRCFNTGDTAHETHVRSLLRAAPTACFHDGFGASELGMALFNAVSTRATGVCGKRNVGRPVPFAQACILDELGNPLPRGSIGYLAVRSPTITVGYYRDPLLTSRCRTPEGDWITGDVGYLDEAGAFIHLDRAVDVMQTPRGPAYSLALEEAVLCEVKVADVSITGIPLTPRTSQAVVAYLRVPPADASAVCEHVVSVLDSKLQERFGSALPVAVVNTDPDMPAAVGATGKVLKRVLREQFWLALQALEEGRQSPFTHAIRRNF